MPARLAKLRKALRAFGCDVEQPRRGSHWRAYNADRSLMYPIPAHNGLKSEIPDIYIRGVCNTFALDLEEFKRKL